MGQKINPLGLRLGTIQSHHSFWFAKPNNFSMSLQEDERIRNFINNYVKKKNKISSSFKGIVYIVIQKRINFIQIIIYIGFINLLIKELQMNVQKEFNYINLNHKLNIAIIRIERPYGQPTILAEYISLQLKKRVSFRKAMKKAIELTEQMGTKGIKVQISGRIDGKEIARVEWSREGRVPLQTIRAKINYCSHTIKTIYGTLGIKIWIFVNP
uniref:Small ribosomal subunit protein uS3c n=1 Tax=Yoania squamipes TaxID=2876154 RepID=A0A9E7V805_9ASPA|nr:ribosomal protein S3 [Yoania squamipes]UZA66557.1 ribosomal protein S3 [Yoania squamipes]UZA66582.1 ribosomal protein S3 [Yoania squamipes]